MDMDLVETGPAVQGVVAVKAMMEFRQVTNPILALPWLWIEALRPSGCDAAVVTLRLSPTQPPLLTNAAPLSHHPDQPVLHFRGGQGARFGYPEMGRGGEPSIWAGKPSVGQGTNQYAEFRSRVSNQLL